MSKNLEKSHDSSGDKPAFVESGEKIVETVSHDMAPKSVLTGMAEVAGLEGNGSNAHNHNEHSGDHKNDHATNHGHKAEH